MSDNCPDDIELHRPFIDAVTLRCPKCGGEMKRVPEVIDCWFDSGAMPFAQWHYPFENQEIFQENFPADFISEAVDQTRGWFYSLLAISTLIFDRAPYKNVIVLGLVQDENGQKMSKSKGNAVDPFEALETYGADAIRWYFYSNSAPWLPNRFYKEAVVDGQRKFMGTLWNTYAFFVLYANIDNFDPTKYTLDYDSLPVMDKWLLSKLNSMVKECDDNLANYRITETTRVLENFVDELSNWYVRRSRERFWVKGMPQDKINAYMTLYTALVTLAKAAAPMIPFMTEEIYRNLVCNVDPSAPESVHLCLYPEVREEWINTELETRMEEVLSVVILGRACRNGANIKNRQPIGKMYVKSDDIPDMPAFYTDIIKSELNIKEVVFTSDVRHFTTYSFKPQLKTLGRRFGKELNEVREILANLDGNRAMDEINETGSLKIQVAGREELLSKDDLLIDAAQMPGYESVEDNGITVVLDTNLTEELIEEGFVREVISKIQNMRKDSGFEVMDHIDLYISGNDRVADIIKRNEAQIRDEVLGESIHYGAVSDNAKEWTLNGEKVTLGVVRK
jgi:isoleucyl-tRNA synthetase